MVVRGRLVFSARDADELVAAAAAASGEVWRVATNSAHPAVYRGGGGGAGMSILSDDAGSVGSASVSSLEPGERAEDATAAFYLAARKFFDPSLDAPVAPAASSPAARAQRLLGMVSVVTLELGTLAQRTNPSIAVPSSSPSLEWSAPSAVLGVVKAGLDEVVLNFSASALAGPTATLEVRMRLSAVNTHAVRFGPFPVSASGGDVDTGEIHIQPPDL
jgi:hypothetical protein